MKLFTVLLNLLCGAAIWYLSLDYFETLAMSMGPAALALEMLLFIGMPLLTLGIALCTYLIQWNMLRLYYDKRRFFLLVFALVLILILVFATQSIGEFPRSPLETEAMFTSFAITGLVTIVSAIVLALRILQNNARNVQDDL